MRIQLYTELDPMAQDEQPSSNIISVYSNDALFLLLCACMELHMCMYSTAVPAVGGPVMPTAGPPSPPVPPSAEDRVELITGFKTVMVRTMTESGEQCTSAHVYAYYYTHVHVHVCCVHVCACVYITCAFVHYTMYLYFYCT